MKAKIHIVNSKEKSRMSREFFDSFLENFDYLNDIELVFGPDNCYDKYEEDLKTISRGWSETAEIIDTRDLVGYEQDPVRLLLTDKFYDLTLHEKNETILHELGHYFTNPSLYGIRNYIALKNPPIINVNNGNLQQLINAHNAALNFVFQIPKLMQEVNAELWVFKKNRAYSETRIKKYCSTIEQSINDFKTAKVEEGWFYEIPRLNFLILWRIAIFQSLDFDYINDCIHKTNEANNLFIKLAATVNWNQLKIFTLQSFILQSLMDSNIKNLIEYFEEIFEDFIINSSHFFPANMQRQLIEFYK